MRAACLILLVAAASAGPLTDGRRPASRKKRLSAMGGSAGTEKAVAGALEWLARAQGDDGLWDADGFPGATDGDRGGGWHGERVPCPFDVEVSALATLAFLGAGHTDREGPYARHVSRALERLAASVEGGTLFATAFVTQALAEARDLTGDETSDATIERGIALMTGSRLPDGGWRYYPGIRMASGVPTTAAVVRALWAAKAAGFDVPEDHEKPVLAWLDRLVAGDGRVAYTLDAHALGYTPTTSNAASALLIRTLLGRPASDPALRKGIAAVGKRRPKWSVRFRRVKVGGVVREVQIGHLNHYYWHHSTEALARIGGAPWKAWNASLKKALLPNQREDGSWDPAGTYGKVGGRVFSTALCALMLESYYR